MKPKGPHPREALTAQFVHEVRERGFYADGNGLYLRVDPSGTKRWVLRTMAQGKRSDIGLGGFSWISLVEARARAKSLRKIAREGGDPFAARVQVFQTLSPEVAKAQNEALELLKKAGVEIDDIALTHRDEGNRGLSYGNIDPLPTSPAE